MTHQFDDITIEQVARLPRPGTTVPGNIQFTPDSTAICYLMSAEGNLARSLWRYDIATGERRIIAGPPAEQAFSREEELRRERARNRFEGVTTYAFAKDAPGEVLLAPMAGALSVSFDGGPLTSVPGTEGAVDPWLSPDGSRVAFIRDGDLYVVEFASGALTRITETAEDGLTSGMAEFIAAEELDRDRGFWWSPDGRKIAFIEADSRHVPIYPIVHQGKDTVDIENHRYPFAGAANAYVRLGVVDLGTGQQSWMDLGDDRDIYLARVDWRAGGSLTAQVLSRDQKDLTLVTFDGREGRTLAHEHREPWLNLSHQGRFLDSGEMIWPSESTGFRHLSLRTAEGGEVRQLTSGEWVVSNVIGVDEARRLVYFTGNREDPKEQHIYRVPLDGGGPERLTDLPGTHSGVLSRDGRYLVDYYSTVRHAPTITLIDLSSGSRTALFANEGNSAAELGLTPPEFVTLPAADGTTSLQGAIYWPPAMDHDAKYPVVVSVYGGPHAQRVVNDWSMTVDMRAQYLARRGFVVFAVDNRGSWNRGLAFEGHLHLRMGTVEVEDQAAAVRWLGAEYGSIDLDRVGVYGWSYGGYMTLLCLLKHPALFKVGVAGAPVTDWDGYDTGYTERYMSTPQKNPEGYREGSVLTHAGKLEGKLLVVHGLIDENVHFRHTGRLLTALTAAGKEYDLLFYPEERHMPRDAKGLLDHERRVLGYFERHL
jgi:dipeptidyl-peptidase 4